MTNFFDREKKLSRRAGFGNLIAMLMACSNLYNIRQKIVKTSISLTKSNNPMVVRLGSLFVASGYGVGLFLLWQIPLVFFDFAMDLREGMTTGIYSLIIPPSKMHPFLFDLMEQTLESQEPGRKN